MGKRSDRILVLGIGNDIQRDVSLPVRLTEDLEALLGTGSLDYGNVCVGGLELLEHINGYRGVVFIDTIRAGEGLPGRVRAFGMESYRETLHLSCRHDVSFRDSLEVGKRLGIDVPDRILILGIDILEDLEFGLMLSDELRDRYPEILSRVRNHIEEFSRRTLISTSI
jgi:hydrogenase maturation protease